MQSIQRIYSLIQNFKPKTSLVLQKIALRYRFVELLSNSRLIFGEKFIGFIKVMLSFICETNGCTLTECPMLSNR